MNWLVAALVERSDICCDDVWVVDSTPVECGRSGETARRSDLAGWAEYGYCDSHSRYFWGLRLHLFCTLHGLPVGYALTGAKADERQVFLDILTGTPAMNRLHSDGHRQILIGDKINFVADFEQTVEESGIELLRPARKGEKQRPRGQILQHSAANHRVHQRHPHGQLDLKQHGGRTPSGVVARVIQRLLAMTAAIWHSDQIGATIRRSLTAYDH